MRNLVLVPLSSGFGSLGIPVTVARLGGTLLLLERFEASAALRMITTQDPTHVFGVPTMLRRMADQAPTTAEGTSSLRAVVASGAPLNATTIEACRRRFDCPILNIYGSSDGVNCHTTPADSPPQPGQAGRPDPSVASIRVVDEAGEPLPPGELGEIWARGPMTPLCYVGASRLNERYRTEGGWVRSGDLGRMARDGQLWVVGRIGQVVIRGGENISPAEVERELTTHPRIREAVCVGVPDPELGQRLCACVVQAPQADAVALAELRAFLADERGVRRRLLPEFLVVVPALPLGPTGKISREAITSLAADRLDDRRQGDAGPAPSRSDTTPPETRDR